MYAYNQDIVDVLDSGPKSTKVQLFVRPEASHTSSMHIFDSSLRRTVGWFYKLGVLFMACRCP